MAYQQPMVTVDQNMTITPTSIERDQPAFIFGPNYELHRYSDEGEKQGTFVGTYVGNAMNVPYPGVMDVEAVDKSYTKLTGDNVVVLLEDLGAATLPEHDASPRLVEVGGGYTKLFFAGKRYVKRDVDTGISGQIEELPQELVAGDSLIVSYEFDEMSASSGESRGDVLTTISNVEYSSTGFDLDNDVESGDSGLETGAGTLITIAGVIPANVDTSSIKVKLVDVFDGVEFTGKNYAEGHSPKYLWTQPDEKISDEYGDDFYGVHVSDSLNASVRGYFAQDTYCKVLSADLYVTYRELNTSYADTLHSVVAASEVENMLGTVSPDNPLAMGVYMACLNAVTDDGDEAPPVYFMAVPSDNPTGYDAVLNKASLTDKVYALAPTTRDKDILEKVRTHVLEMSVKTVKQWRIACASAEIPETVDCLNSKMDPQGDDFLAIPASKNGIAVGDGVYNMFRVVKSSTNVQGNNDASLKSRVVKGDTVRFHFYKDAWGEPIYDIYTVKNVMNNFTLEVELVDRTGDGTLDGIDTSFLADQDGAPHYTPTKIEIFHTYTASETAEEVRKISKAMASRRMINVFPSVFGSGDVKMTGEFAACAIAGLISGTEPQQPITNMTVRGIDDVPMIYQVFNRADLNTMASGGTFIIAQDMPNDLVYVRHQITTAYPDGNLNTAELSVTKNVDSISYAFAEVFRPYIGKYNITPELEATLDNRTKDLVSQFARSTSVYGPQLIAEETELLYVRQNELMKDHIDIGVRLGVPYPCNNIDIVLTV